MKTQAKTSLIRTLYQAHILQFTMIYLLQFIKWYPRNSYVFIISIYFKMFIIFSVFILCLYVGEMLQHIFTSQKTSCGCWFSPCELEWLNNWMIEFRSSRLTENTSTLWVISSTHYLYIFWKNINLAIKKQTNHNMASKFNFKNLICKLNQSPL